MKPEIPTIGAIQTFVAQIRMRFIIGVALVGIALSVAQLLTFAKIWVEEFEKWGIPAMVLYIALPLLYVVSCWGVGYLYQTWGFYAAEASFNNTKGNPELMQIKATLDRIEKKFNEEEM